MLDYLSIPKALAFASVIALAACSGQLVDPQVSERLSVQAVNVGLAPEINEEISLNGVSFQGNFIAKVQASSLGRGSIADVPTDIEVSFNRVNISMFRGSTATGSYTVVNANSGAVMFGPQEFSVQTQGTNNAGGGLIGLAVGAVVAGAAQQNHNAFLREVEELGALVGSRIKIQVFG